MSTLLKKLIFSSLAFLVLFISVAPNFLAAKAAAAAAAPTPAPETTWYNSTFGDWWNKVYDSSNPSEIFGERYTAAQVQWVIYGLFAFVLNATLGSSNQKIVACFLTNTTNLNSCAQLLQGMISQTDTQNHIATNTDNKNLFQLVFASDRPLSGISYLKEKTLNFGLVPVANAQTAGFGFGALDPIQTMWSKVRDIAFGMFVLAAIILSFMIMFRVKISPQVVISVQSAIPKLLIALVLVTFSYAIAGFMVDLMYVVIGLLSLIGPSLTVFHIAPTEVFTFLTRSNIFWVMLGYLIALTFSFLAMMIMMVGLLGTLAGAAITAGILAGSLGTAIIIVAVIVLVIMIIVVLHMMKTLWALLKAFAKVLLLVIFAPLQIVAGVVMPNFGFTSWLKNLAAALSTFIVTGALMLFSIVFMINGVMLGFQDFFGGAPGSANLGATILHFFLGTAIGAQVTGHTSPGWPPLLGGGTSLTTVGLLFLGVSFVLFTLIPKATDIVQSFITGKPFAYGAAIGEALGPAMMAGQAVMESRSGRDKARLETAIRQAEAQGTAGGYARATRMRQQLASLEQAEGLAKRVMSGR